MQNKFWEFIEVKTMCNAIEIVPVISFYTVSKQFY